MNRNDDSSATEDESTNQKAVGGVDHSANSDCSHDSAVDLPDFVSDTNAPCQNKVKVDLVSEVSAQEEIVLPPQGFYDDYNDEGDDVSEDLGLRNLNPEAAASESTDCIDVNDKIAEQECGLDSLPLNSDECQGHDDQLLMSLLTETPNKDTNLMAEVDDYTDLKNISVISEDSMVTAKSHESSDLDDLNNSDAFSGDLDLSNGSSHETHELTTITAVPHSDVSVISDVTEGAEENVTSESSHHARTEISSHPTASDNAEVQSNSHVPAEDDLSEVTDITEDEESEMEHSKRASDLELYLATRSPNVSGFIDEQLTSETESSNNLNRYDLELCEYRTEKLENNIVDDSENNDELLTLLDSISEKGKELTKQLLMSELESELQAEFNHSQSIEIESVVSDLQSDVDRLQLENQMLQEELEKERNRKDDGNVIARLEAELTRLTQKVDLMESEGSQGKSTTVDDSSTVSSSGEKVHQLYDNDSSDLCDRRSILDNLLLSPHTSKRPPIHEHTKSGARKSTQESKSYISTSSDTCTNSLQSSLNSNSVSTHHGVRHVESIIQRSPVTHKYNKAQATLEYIEEIIHNSSFNTSDDWLDKSANSSLNASKNQQEETEDKTEETSSSDPLIEKLKENANIKKVVSKSHDTKVHIHVDDSNVRWKELSAKTVITKDDVYELQHSLSSAAIENEILQNKINDANSELSTKVSEMSKFLIETKNELKKSNEDVLRLQKCRQEDKVAIAELQIQLANTKAKALTLQEENDKLKDQLQEAVNLLQETNEELHKPTQTTASQTELVDEVSTSINSSKLESSATAVSDTILSESDSELDDSNKTFTIQTLTKDDSPVQDISNHTSTSLNTSQNSSIDHTYPKQEDTKNCVKNDIKINGAKLNHDSFVTEVENDARKGKVNENDTNVNIACSKSTQLKNIVDSPTQPALIHLPQTQNLMQTSHAVVNTQSLMSHLLQNNNAITATLPGNAHIQQMYPQMVAQNQGMGLLPFQALPSTSFISPPVPVNAAVAPSLDSSMQIGTSLHDYIMKNSEQILQGLISSGEMSGGINATALKYMNQSSLERIIQRQQMENDFYCNELKQAQLKLNNKDVSSSSSSILEMKDEDRLSDSINKSTTSPIHSTPTKRMYTKDSEETKVQTPEKKIMQPIDPASVKSEIYSLRRQATFSRDSLKAEPSLLPRVSELFSPPRPSVTNAKGSECLKEVKKEEYENIPELSHCKGAKPLMTSSPSKVNNSFIREVSLSPIPFNKAAFDNSVVVDDSHMFPEKGNELHKDDRVERQIYPHRRGYETSHHRRPEAEVTHERPVRLSYGGRVDEHLLDKIHHYPKIDDRMERNQERRPNMASKTVSSSTSYTEKWLDDLQSPSMSEIDTESQYTVGSEDQYSENLREFQYEKDDYNQKTDNRINASLLYRKALEKKQRRQSDKLDNNAYRDDRYSSADSIETRSDIQDFDTRCDRYIRDSNYPNKLSSIEQPRKQNDNADITSESSYDSRSTSELYISRSGRVYRTKTPYLNRVKVGQTQSSGDQMYNKRHGCNYRQDILPQSNDVPSDYETNSTLSQQSNENDRYYHKRTDRIINKSLNYYEHPIRPNEKDTVTGTFHENVTMERYDERANRNQDKGYVQNKYKLKDIPKRGSSKSTDRSDYDDVSHKERRKNNPEFDHNCESQQPNFNKYRQEIFVDHIPVKLQGSEKKLRFVDDFSNHVEPHRHKIERRESPADTTSQKKKDDSGTDQRNDASDSFTAQRYDHVTHKKTYRDLDRVHESSASDNFLERLPYSILKKDIPYNNEKSVQSATKMKNRVRYEDDVKYQANKDKERSLNNDRLNQPITTVNSDHTSRSSVEEKVPIRNVTFEDNYQKRHYDKANIHQPCVSDDDKENKDLKGDRMNPPMKNSSSQDKNKNYLNYQPIHKEASPFNMRMIEKNSEAYLASSSKYKHERDYNSNDKFPHDNVTGYHPQFNKKADDLAESKTTKSSIKDVKKSENVKEINIANMNDISQATEIKKITEIDSADKFDDKDADVPKISPRAM